MTRTFSSRGDLKKGDSPPWDAPNGVLRDRRCDGVTKIQYNVSCCLDTDLSGLLSFLNYTNCIEGSADSLYVRDRFSNSISGRFSQPIVNQLVLLLSLSATNPILLLLHTTDLSIQRSEGSLYLNRVLRFRRCARSADFVLRVHRRPCMYTKPLAIEHQASSPNAQKDPVCDQVASRFRNVFTPSTPIRQYNSRKLQRDVRWSKSFGRAEECWGLFWSHRRLGFT